MSDPNDLAAFLDLAWQRLSRGVADRRAPARYPGFATVSATGLPELRTVALRQARRAADLLEVHTDTKSAKIEALHHTPWAELMVWDGRVNLQMRLLCEVEIVTGSATQDRWASVPPSSRISYGTQPAPGTPVSHVYDYEKPPDPERFAILQCHLHRIDLLQLDKQHRRAKYLKNEAWRGTWLAP